MSFIANFIHAHDGSYEMNYENFIAHNKGFTTSNAVLSAKEYINGNETLIKNPFE